MKSLEHLEQIGAEVGNTDDDLSNCVETDLPKRKQCLKWFFTFNNYKKEQMEQMEQLIKKYSKCGIFQEEIGKKGTQHLQGCFHLKKQKRLTELKKMFFNEINFQVVRSWEHSIHYCSKVDTKIKGGNSFNFNVKIKKPIKILDESKFYDWEKFVIKVIKEEPDDRSIYWLHESVGNTGKSTFCKYLCVKHNALLISGKASDMKYGIIKYMEKHGNYPELIILDIPRKLENYVSYNGIEEVKNACFFSSKYESDMVVGNCPHFFIFANFEPEYQYLSKDRWIVKNIRCDFKDL